MNQSLQLKHDRQLAIWLFCCAFLILAMILLGGMTRLTGSGLSMVEWKPIMGVIPPLTELQWQESFLKYQQYPEYQLVNRGMSLSGYKAIFLYEYAHRVLGRLIGLVYFLPFAAFMLAGRVRPEYRLRLLLVGLLGGLQGLLGWYMVKSGLVLDPHVSQYRLAAHLGMAAALYGYILWLALGLSRQPVPAPLPGRLRPWSYLITALLFLMILSGGLVAGTRAGLAYSNWPMMGPAWLPATLYATDPAWLAIFEDIGTIQFNHRVLAYVLLVLIVGFCTLALRSGIRGRLRAGVLLMLALVFLQSLLGIATLLLLVPTPLAIAHQAGAVALFSSAVFVSEALRRRAAVAPFTGSADRSPPMPGQVRAEPASP